MNEQLVIGTKDYTTCTSLDRSLGVVHDRTHIHAHSLPASHRSIHVLTLCRSLFLSLCLSLLFSVSLCVCLNVTPTHTHTFTGKHTYTSTHTHTHARTHPHIHARCTPQTQVHTYTHIYAHTHTCTPQIAGLLDMVRSSEHPPTPSTPPTPGSVTVGVSGRGGGRK